MERDSGCSSLLDHHNDVGIGRIIDIEIALDE